MNRWLVGVVVGMIACAAGFLLVIDHLTPPPVCVDSALETETEVEPTTPEIPAPVVLAEVIETADIDPLLDPPEKPITGVPFDEDNKPRTSAMPPTPPIPTRIPPAVEEVP